MTGTALVRADNPGLGILLMIVAACAISLNDMSIKWLSGDYPLHQMIFARSAIGILISLAILQFEGGIRLLRTDAPLAHLARGCLIVVANMTFFAGLAVLPLASATALFFVAPLFITLLSVPVLGERVGPWRMGAVAAGFAGAAVMLRPWEAGEAIDRWALALPIVAALCYAGTQIMTRRLGIAAKASAMAIYIQATFIAVSIGFWAVAGDGRFAEGVENPALVFLLRPWVWPTSVDWVWLVALGINSGVVAYCLSQAYRVADVAVVAPFEYISLGLAVFWGWAVFGEVPGPFVWAGICLIAGAGLVVFLRERIRARPVATARPLRRG